MKNKNIDWISIILISVFSFNSCVSVYLCIVDPDGTTLFRALMYPICLIAYIILLIVVKNHTSKRYLIIYDDYFEIHGKSIFDSTLVSERKNFRYLKYEISSSVEKKFMVSRNEFFIAVALLSIAISTNKNDVQMSWIYNGRDDLASKSSVGLLCRELSVALRLHNKSDLRDIFAEIHNQVRDGIKYSCYPYMAMKPQNEEGDIACVIYQRDIREGDDFSEINMERVKIAQNDAAAQSVLDIQILDGEDGLQYVFDYAAGRYELETMTEFQNLFRSVIAAIVNNVNTEGYDFEHLKKEVCDKKGLMQKIKDTFAKKK